MSGPSTLPVVRLSSVVKTYRAGAVDVPAIKGISLDIPRQRFSMIVGPSGSGKTTLLNLVGCIDKPTSGFSSENRISALSAITPSPIFVRSASASSFRTSA